MLQSGHGSRVNIDRSHCCLDMTTMTAQGTRGQPLQCFQMGLNTWTHQKELVNLCVTLLGTSWVRSQKCGIAKVLG